MKTWTGLLLLAFALLPSIAISADDDPLGELKLRFARGRDRIRGETAASVAQLDKQYADRLVVVRDQLMQQGNLEGILAVDQEMSRFRKAAKVTGPDVVITPAELAKLQQWYLTQRNRISDDESGKLSKLAQTYLHYLDREKRKQTKQGNISLAITIKNEENRVLREFQDLPREEEPAARVNQPAPAKPAKPAGPRPAATSERRLTNIHPPPGEIWVILRKDGFPARKVAVQYRESPRGTLATLETDTMGQVKIPAHPHTPYDIMIISKEHAFDRIEAAAGGEAYRMDLRRNDGGSGTVLLKRGSCELPVIGEIYTSGTWSSSNDQRGPVLRARDPDVMFGRGNSSENWLHCWPDRTYTVTDGDVTYEFVLIEFGGDVQYGIKYELK